MLKPSGNPGLNPKLTLIMQITGIIILISAILSKIDVFKIIGPLETRKTPRTIIPKTTYKTQCLQKSDYDFAQNRLSRSTKPPPKAAQQKQKSLVLQQQIQKNNQFRNGKFQLWPHALSLFCKQSKLERADLEEQLPGSEPSSTTLGFSDLV